MSSNQTYPRLLEELAVFLATVPTCQQMLDFKPSGAMAKRASELLQLNRTGTLDRESEKELDQIACVESLMRLVKARIHEDASRP